MDPYHKHLVKTSATFISKIFDYFPLLTHGKTLSFPFKHLCPLLVKMEVKAL